MLQPYTIIDLLSWSPWYILLTTWTCIERHPMLASKFNACRQCKTNQILPRWFENMPPQSCRILELYPIKTLQTLITFLHQQANPYQTVQFSKFKKMMSHNYQSSSESGGLFFNSTKASQRSSPSLMLFLCSESQKYDNGIQLISLIYNEPAKLALQLFPPLFLSLLRS